MRYRPYHKRRKQIMILLSGVALGIVALLAIENVDAITRGINQQSIRLTPTPNQILTEDNYMAELVPSNIQVMDKGRYNLISFTVTINVQNLPIDGSVYFEDLYTTLSDNSKVYQPDSTECSMSDLIPVIGKETSSTNYNVCFSVDKTSNTFSILYTEPPFNYHATRIGHLSLDTNLFSYYESHHHSQPIQIGTIDLPKP